MKTFDKTTYHGGYRHGWNFIGIGQKNAARNVDTCFHRNTECEEHRDDIGKDRRFDWLEMSSGRPNKVHRDYNAPTGGHGFVRN